MKLRFGKLHRVFAAVICLLLLCSTALAARTGSLRVEVEDAGRGMSVTLYHVATKNGALTAPFAACGLSQSQLTKESERRASSAALAAYVKDKNLPCAERTTDGRGVVTFDDLSVGIYLVCGEGASMIFDPFLVSIPTKIGVLTIYDVKAQPKAEPIKPVPSDSVVTPTPVTPTPTPVPSQPPVTPTPGDPVVSPTPSDPTASPTPGGPSVSPTPGDPTVSPSPSDPVTTPTPSGPEKPPNIPQTGVQVWPIHLLLALGALFIVTGLCLLQWGRKEHHEES